ncbi:MAG: cytochrome d ubiquinol oxidase subunit II [Jatrophihabitans sp.]|uniref:cytochrome d ubiquinol oxidase subunit II n=1 Tax=Jatrophihabitans sp. TaxID=1932789 RepID=UPI003910EAB9
MDGRGARAHPRRGRDVVRRGGELLDEPAGRNHDAQLGIVLRGAGFAFAKVLERSPDTRVNGAAFAVSSITTPFFFGTVAGGVASGRVPTAGNGDAVRSCLNPTSLLGGAIAVTVCAYLAAAFLSEDARVRGEDDLVDWARRRAVSAAVTSGALSLAGLFVLHSDAHRLWTHLLHAAVPLVVVSVLSGSAALVLLRRGAPRVVRVLAVVAVGAIVLGWGVAQYPYLLGTHLSIGAAAARTATPGALAVVTGLAALLVVPSIALLFVLQQRARLE